MVNATDYAGNTGSQSVQYGVIPAPSSTIDTDPYPKPEPGPKAAAPILKGSLSTTSSGHLTLNLTCSGSARCAGKATLYTPGASKHSKRIELASGRYSVAAHKQGTLALRIKHAALALLHRYKDHLKVSLVLAPRGGKTRTINTRLTLHRA